MYIRPEQIAEQYEMEVKSISKGRDCFLCETDLGMRALKEYRGSVERAEFLAGMLDFLKEQNIVAEQIFYTKEGEIFARDEEEQNYLLLSVFRGAECDTKSREDMVYAVRLLAGLHNATERYPDEVPEFVKMNPNALLLLYEKHNRELRQVRNYIRGRKQKNEFEEMFMRQFAGFFEKAQAVTEQLQNMEIREELTGFCHGDYNQHNVVFSREGVAVVNFLNFSYQIRVSDLSNFVRKMMEKTNWNTPLGMELIGAYDSGAKWYDSREFIIAKAVRILLQHNLQVRRGAGRHLDGLRLKAYRTKCQFPTIMTRNLELTVQIARFCHMMPLIYSTCQWYRITIGVVNFACNLGFDRNHQSQ